MSNHLAPDTIAKPNSFSPVAAFQRVFALTAVSPYERLVLLALISRCSLWGDCTVSLQRLTKTTNMSRTSIVRVLRRLEDGGFIERSSGVGRANSYTVRV